MVKITSLRGALIREFAAADKGSPGCVKRTADCCSWGRDDGRDKGEPARAHDPMSRSPLLNTTYYNARRPIRAHHTKSSNQGRKRRSTCKKMLKIIAILVIPIIFTSLGVAIAYFTISNGTENGK